MTPQDPRSDRPAAPDTDAMAVGSMPDEVRLHADPDETELSQPSVGGPVPEPPATDDVAEESNDGE